MNHGFISSNTAYSWQTIYQSFLEKSVDSKVFVRSKSSDKTIAGQIVDIKDFDEFFYGTVQNINDFQDFIISSPKKIDFEFRFFLNFKNRVSKILHGCTYAANGLITKNKFFDPKAADFVLENSSFIKECLYKYYIDNFNVVVDVARIGNEYKIVEFNSPYSSGIYGLDEANDSFLELIQ